MCFPNGSVSIAHVFNTVLKTHVLGSAADLFNQKFCGRGLVICILTGLEGDAGAAKVGEPLLYNLI